MTSALAYQGSSIVTEAPKIIVPFPDWRESEIHEEVDNGDDKYVQNPYDGSRLTYL